MPQRSIVIVTITALALVFLAVWGYSVYQVRQTRNHIVTHLKATSEAVRAGLKPESQPGADLEAAAAAGAARVTELRNRDTAQLRPLAEAADDYLVTGREILRRQADIKQSSERLSVSLQAFAQHMQSDRGMGTWPAEAVRQRHSVDQDFRAYRIAVETYAALLETLPASQRKIAPHVDPALLIDEKTLNDVRQQTLTTFAQTQENITRLTRIESYRTPGGAARSKQTERGQR
jgi:hypothetical protein